MTQKLKFMCENCGCEADWDEEGGERCHCFWEEDEVDYPEDTFDFEETMGTA